MNDWYEYVVATAGTSNQTRIAEDAGFKQSTISKWKSGTTPEPAAVAKFATHYEANVLEAFVVAGFLTPEQAEAKPTLAPKLGDIPREGLVREVAKRLGVQVEVVQQESGDDTDLIVAASDPGTWQESNDPSRR